MAPVCQLHSCAGPQTQSQRRVALSQANLSLGFPSKSSLFAWGNSPKLKTKAAWGKASEGKLQISLGRSLGALRPWGRRHGGDVAACRCGTFHAIQWSLCRQLNKAWLASVQAARPGLTQRAQAELARRTQQHRNSSSCNSESGFSDVLVICRGGSNMILSAENLFVH